MILYVWKAFIYLRRYQICLLTIQEMFANKQCTLSNLLTFVLLHEASALRILCSTSTTLFFSSCAAWYHRLNCGAPRIARATLLTNMCRQEKLNGCFMIFLRQWGVPGHPTSIPGVLLNWGFNWTCARSTDYVDVYFWLNNKKLHFFKINSS